MTLYSNNINTSLYKYFEPIYITDNSGQDRTVIPVNLSLNAYNFNFDLSRPDGLDFRIAERSNGTGVFLMWVAYWSDDNSGATIWFKLPSLLANETKEVWVFWGNEADSGISNIDSMVDNDPVFLFAEGFDTNVLNTSRWPSTGGSYVLDSSSVIIGVDSWIQSTSFIISRPGKFILEEGVESNGSPTSTTSYAHRYQFLGGENEFEIRYFWNGGTDRQHNFVDGGAVVTYNGINKGLIDGYNQLYVAYFEDTDYIYQGMQNRGGEASPVYSEDLATEYSHATAQSSNPGHPTAWLPGRAVDGDVNTRWIGGPTNPCWWGYFFDFAQPITKIILQMNSSPLPSLQVEASNDPATVWDSKIWTDIIYDAGQPATGTYEWVMDFDNTIPYLYWRIQFFTPSPYLPEIEMYSILYYAGEFDYEDSWERDVHRNTEVDHVRIYGADTSSSKGVAIDWVIARLFDPANEPFVNTGSLYTQYEYVAHQPIDTTEYGPDITSVDFYHSSSMGGDPYRMSDNVSTGLGNSFISDEVTQGSMFIDFGRLSERSNSANYIHYSNSFVEFYNAAKLSDLDDDVYGADYWQATESSDVWASILFPERITIRAISVRAVSGNLNGMIKNYNIYGSNKDPRFNGWDEKVLLYSGQFLKSADEQVIYMSNTSSWFYYILEVVDSYGSNVALQEWSFYLRTPETTKKVISQFRFKPVVDTINEYYFPKQIKLEASNDLISWTTLINTNDTATPFTDFNWGRWQRFSFDNFNGYYTYKLTCYSNWRAAIDGFKMAEWEMVERIEESNSYRILGGSTNDFNSVWTAPGTNFNSGYFYTVNDVLNTIRVDELIESTTVSGSVSDINAKGS